LIKRLKELIDLQEIPERQELLLIHDFYFAKALFKDCKFSETESLCQSYYNKIVEAKHEKGLPAMWVNISVMYALSVKELYGNERAKDVLKTLYNIFPEQLLVGKEYFIHLSCMNFYSAPEKSVKHVKKVLNMFQQHPTSELPFHEYGDLAMCYLLAKKYEEAIEAADNAIKISESNGVMAEVGRANNIKSCALICLNQLKLAEPLAEESFWILEEFKYPLYSWRSQLNYVQILIAQENRSDQVKYLLHDVYKKILSTCGQKMVALIEADNYTETREYHALVLLGKLCRILDIDSLNIINDFNLSSIQDLYLSHVDEASGLKAIGKLFMKSPYYHNGFILVVG